jgi:hypothetical protein
VDSIKKSCLPKLPVAVKAPHANALHAGEFTANGQIANRIINPLQSKENAAWANTQTASIPIPIVQ